MRSLRKVRKELPVWGGNYRENEEGGGGIRILADSGKLAVGIGFIIINTFCGIHAAAISGNIIKILRCNYAAPGHGYGVKDMEKL